MINITQSKKELKFCFYCGSLLPDIDITSDKNCPYCGVKLPYKHKKKKVNHYF